MSEPELETLTVPHRECAKEDCHNIIKPVNKSGYCSRHFHLSERVKDSAKKSTPHLVAHSAVTIPDVPVDCLNRWWTNLPAPDKGVVFGAWLRGQ